MSTFLRPSKKSLKNAQHYELMDAFITVLNDANLTATKITALPMPTVRVRSQVAREQEPVRELAPAQAAAQAAELVLEQARERELVRAPAAIMAAVTTTIPM